MKVSQGLGSKLACVISIVVLIKPSHNASQIQGWGNSLHLLMAGAASHIARSMDTGMRWRIGASFAIPCSTQ